MMREIIQFSEEHPAILVSEILSIMPPVKVDPLNESSSVKPSFWRVTFGMRGGSNVHVHIYASEIEVDDEERKMIEMDPVKYGLHPGAGRLEIASAVRVRTAQGVVMRFFKDSVETWKYWEED